MEILYDLETEKKIFSLTLDNVSSNGIMQLNVNEQLCLQDNLLCDSEFFHIKCCTRILNLVVEEGLKIASIANERIRNIYIYIYMKSSEVRMMSFEKYVKKTKSSSNAYLFLDLSTQQNYNYLMLECALKYRHTFALLDYCMKCLNRCGLFWQMMMGIMLS